jgi:hypothetical protein
LYGGEYGRARRHAIQKHNFEVIHNGVAQYSLQPDRKQVFLPGLIINGANSSEATLNFVFNPTSTLLTYIEHPELAGMLCRLDMRATTESMLDWQQEEIPFWRVEGRILQTSIGYEGNGYANALWHATETIVPAWIHYLGAPSRVLAYHVDGARGAEEPTEQKQGYRTNWTSNLLSKLDTLIS